MINDLGRDLIEAVDENIEKEAKIHVKAFNLNTKVLELQSVL